jgi:hypothetical protein
MLKDIYRFYSDPAAARQLLADSAAQAVSWRWASESMAEEVPFLQEKYGGPKAKWIADDKADAVRHVHHGFDTAGRLVIQRDGNGRETAWLHEADRRTGVQFSLHEDEAHIGVVTQYRDAGGLLASHHVSHGHKGFDERFLWENGQLQRAITSNWAKGKKTWLCQDVYRYDDAALLDTITLEYLDEDGQPDGQRRLTYRRPRKGETLASVAAKVEAMLIAQITEALALIPRDEKIYCLLICYTEEDFTAAWPPFLVWGRESYRRAVLQKGEEVPYYLWAPDEIREVQGDAHERWFDNASLQESCLLHSQFMDIQQSTASARRVLKNLALHFNAPAAHASLLATDDFVVAHADNTGEVDPLRAMKAGIAPERWALLKERGCV